MISKGSASAAITMNSAIPLFSVLVAVKETGESVQVFLESTSNVKQLQEMLNVASVGRLHGTWVLRDY